MTFAPAGIVEPVDFDVRQGLRLGPFELEPLGRAFVRPEIQLLRAVGRVLRQVLVLDRIERFVDERRGGLAPMGQRVGRGRSGGLRLAGRPHRHLGPAAMSPGVVRNGRELSRFAGDGLAAGRASDGLGLAREDDDAVEQTRLVLGFELRIVRDHQAQDLAVIVGPFEAEHDGSSLEGDPAHIGLDLRVGHDPADRHRQIQGKPVARLPHPLDSGEALLDLERHRLAVDLDRRLLGVLVRESVQVARHGLVPHQPGMRTKTANVSLIWGPGAISIRPFHGYSVCWRILILLPAVVSVASPPMKRFT